MKSKRMLRNQKGFTLIEIIAVLVILGILAAVAVPKYLDLQGDAKEKAAEGQVAEMKGTLSSAWGKAMLANNGAATLTQIMTEAGFNSGVAQDVGTAPDLWNVTLTVSGSAVGITVNSKDTDTDYSATGTWTLPEP